MNATATSSVKPARDLPRVRRGQRANATLKPIAPVPEVSGDFYERLTMRTRALVNEERTLTAVKNRVGALERDGFSEAMQAGLSAAEDALQKAVNARKRQIEDLVGEHPMVDWVDACPGLGRLLFGRIIGATGPIDQKSDCRILPTGSDVYFATVSKVWKYIGMDVRDGHAPRRQKGQRSMWSPEGRVAAHLLGEVIMKLRKDSGAWTRALFADKYAEYLARPRFGPSGCPMEGYRETGHVEHERKQHDRAPKRGAKTGVKVVAPCVKLTEQEDGTTRETSKHLMVAAQRFAAKQVIKEMWVEWQRRAALRSNDPAPVSGIVAEIVKA